MSNNKKLLIASTISAALAMSARPASRMRTADGLQTFDAQTVDSAGAFLIGELERLDQTLNMPLANIRWSRDIQLRSDVGIGDEVSSFTNSFFAAAGGASPNGKNWVGKDATAIKGLSLDIAKTANPLTLWAMELGWSIPELASAQSLGRPVDAMKLEGMELKRQMDIDEQVYIGDATLGVTGLVNATAADLANVSNGSWNNPNTTPQAILADVNALLTRAWKNSGYAICPGKLMLPPVQFGTLTSRTVTDAGNISILEYIKNNCISMSENGTPLEVVSVKWLAGAGAGATDRMVAYTNDRTRVRFPMTPVQRTPLEYRSLNQLTTYFCRLGVVEIPYPETIAYADGI